MSAEREPGVSGPPEPDEVLMTRRDVQGVLRRAGYAKEDIDAVLDGIDFPAPLSVIAQRGQQFGISTGSLIERLGGSP